MKTRTAVITIIMLISIATGSHAQSRSQLSKILHRGITTQSDSLMRVFFEGWFRASDTFRRVPKTTLQKEAEDVVEAMWDPKNRPILLNYPKPDTVTLEPLPPYIVFLYPISIFTESQDSIPQDSIQFTIPRTLYQAKTLFYEKRYGDLLEPYLKWDAVKFEINSTFIARYALLSGHKGGHSVVGEPLISEVKFSSNREKALVYFRLNMAGGIATLEKNNGKWVVISNRETGAE